MFAVLEPSCDSHHIPNGYLRFYLYYEENKGCVRRLLLRKSNTVGDLKTEISKQYGVPPHLQYIEGWIVKPSSNEIPLEDCSMATNRLTITKISEVQVTKSFFGKTWDDARLRGINFWVANFEGALYESCFAPLPTRKILLFWLYKDRDDFSTEFCRALGKVEVRRVVENFIVLAWDISDERYHELLMNTLNSFLLQPLTIFIENHRSAAFCLQNVNGRIAIISCLYDKNSQYILKDLKEAEGRANTSNSWESNLNEVETESEKEQGLTIKRFQQMMADRLSNRDFDRIEFDQRNELYRKVGFFLFGPPQEDTLKYTLKEKNYIDKLYRIIIDESNIVAEYHDLIEIAFIYVCVEPLPEEKLEKSKEIKDYNPYEDFVSFPLFALRKCRESTNPCRIYIDNIGRVYSNWEDFIYNNKLPRGLMHLPRNGRYEVDMEGNVLLEQRLSPSCSVAAGVLKAVDYTTAGMGLVSAGVFTAAIFTPVFPVALLTATITSIGAGGYCIGRSIHTLVDKGTHKESLNPFTDSEARAAYISIVAGTLGFVGMGSNILVGELIKRGVNITDGASNVITALGIANISASGVGIINSTYDIIDGYSRDQPPSPLVLLQLSSSILFFGNAIYNFNSINNMIKESQTSTLQRFVDNLQANKFRKIFENMINDVSSSEGIQVTGRFDTILTVKNICLKIHDLIQFSKENEHEMRKYGAKFTLKHGHIQLNGHNIDMDIFNSMNGNEVVAFRGELPIKSNVDTTDTHNMISIYQQNNLTGDTGLLNFSVKLLSCYDFDVQGIIVKFSTLLWESIPDSFKTILNTLFGSVKKYAYYLEMIFEWFVTKAKELEEQHKKWEETSDPQYYNSLFVFIDTDAKRKRKELFEAVVRNCFRLLSSSTKELFIYAVTWIAMKVYNAAKETVTGRRRREHSASKVGSAGRKRNVCNTCNGYNYS